MSSFLNDRQHIKIEKRIPAGGRLGLSFSKLQILILTADSRIGGKRPMQVAKHVRTIEDALKKSKYRDRFEDILHYPVSKYTDIGERLSHKKPNIVHFIGHGTAAGLELENDDGHQKIIREEQLIGLFRHLSGEIQCVILNACYSESQAEAIHQSINCVIGMSGQIDETESTKFARGFYGMVGDGYLYDKAFAKGANDIGQTEDDDSGVLRLFYRTNPFIEKVQELGDMFRS